jgi:ubiquinone/menaquinone biosynthesis C-methylase UbiE
MGLRGRIFAAVYDRMSARTEAAGLGAMRASVVGEARGDVLEVGGGTGLNLPLYGPAVTSLAVTEPETPMLRRLERRAAELGSPARIVRAPAERLPFEDASFDAVVSTLVLCGVEDQPQALRELRRVLRPGGALLCIEHVRSDDPRLARRQDRMNPLNRFMVCCECNRPTVEAMRAAGFDVAGVRRTSLPQAPAHVRPLAVGRAIAPG